MAETSSNQELSPVKLESVPQALASNDQKQYDLPPDSSEEVRRLVEKFSLDYSKLPFENLIERMGEIYGTMRASISLDNAQTNFLKMANWVDTNKRNKAVGEGVWEESDSLRFKQALERRGYIPLSHTQDQHGPLKEEKSTLLSRLTSVMNRFKGGG